ncbi:MULTISPECIES: NDP-sugar synthase [unclassified Streptomyces]|uniref:NDP-sugar synthase n=1 Tax=unclassified Streptomyces TaxID=2593676 RepID=UPI002DD7E707|nr:NDP-sugar synthase [Streptomyces sp. NBC_01294]WRZ58788.1 NDP-sugar synthase [Streptomyces sp. NBC_01294]
MNEAILLVGGKGTRLQPLTLSRPKPMVSVAGVPFLAHLVARARAAGIERLVMATSYLPETFRAYFGDGSAFGLRLEYVTETDPLGTGGAIRNAARLLTGGPDSPVAVLNGDILSGTDISLLVERHRAADADVTLHLTRVDDPRAYGLVPTGPDGRVLRFLEKPTTAADIVTDQINAGCYVFRRSVIDAIPAGRPVSVERETFPALLASNARVLGITDDAYWLDLGTPEALVRGSADLVLGRVASPALPGPCGEALLLEGARVAPGATVAGGSTIGPGATVHAGAHVSGSILLDGAVVEAGAVVRDSVIGAGAVIGAGTVLDCAVIGDRARVGSGNELRTGLRLWNGAVLAPDSVRFSPDPRTSIPAQSGVQHAAAL